MAFRFSALAIVSALAVLSLATTANADDSAALPEWMLSAGVPLLAHGNDPIPTWSVTALVSAQMLPRYSGSSSLQLRAYPLIDIRYKDVAFASAIEGIGINLLHSPDIRAGFAFNYDSGRSPGDAQQLHGTDHLRPAPDVKAFVDYVLFPVVLRADVRHTLGGAPGWIADTASYVPVFYSDPLVIFCGLSLTWADRNSMNAHYGINTTASAASGLPVYEAGAGLRSASIGTDMTWTLNEHWLLNVTASAQRLGTEPSNSPLVSNHIEPASSLSLGYTF